MWKCVRCETKNDDQNQWCVICGAKRSAFTENTGFENKANPMPVPEDSSPEIGMYEKSDMAMPDEKTPKSIGKRILATCLVAVVIGMSVVIGLPELQRHREAKQNTDETETHSEAETEQEPVEELAAEDLLQFLGQDVNEFAYAHQPVYDYSDYMRWGVNNDSVIAAAFLGSSAVDHIEIWNTDRYTIGGIAVGEDLEEAEELLDREGFERVDGNIAGYRIYENGMDFRIGIKLTDSSAQKVERIYAEDIAAVCELTYFIGQDIREFAQNMPMFENAGASSGLEYHHENAVVCADNRDPKICYVGIQHRDGAYSICGIRYGMEIQEAVARLEQDGFVLDEAYFDGHNRRFVRGNNSVWMYSLYEDHPVVDSVHFDVLDEQQIIYLLPQSEFRYLTEEDLAGLSLQELTLARNEIYARHGYIFSNQELAAYFQMQPWYVGTTYGADFDYDVLNEFEVHNAFFIQEYEEKLKS